MNLQAYPVVVMITNLFMSIDHFHYIVPCRIIIVFGTTEKHSRSSYLAYVQLQEALKLWLQWTQK